VPHLRDSTRAWYSVASSADGTKLVAGVSNGQIYTTPLIPTGGTTTAGTDGSLNGYQGAAIELQYIGNNQLLVLSQAGAIVCN
jgi:hypothetical protein